jgi:hypothetical protein
MTMPFGSGNPLLSRQLLLRLQKTSGNRAVLRMIARQSGPAIEKRELASSATAISVKQTGSGWRTRLSRWFTRGQPSQ